MRLADWEVRHPIIHPRMWAESTDVVTFISSQVDKIVDAQLKAADRVVVSQERIKSGIDKVALGIGMVEFGIDRVASGIGRVEFELDRVEFGIERVYEGLEGLRSTFEWGLSQLVWQFEQERDVLKQILEVLQAPLDTQSKELRRRAVEAYKNGWIEDALQDFLEAEKKNRYDFTIHISLGHIYLFEKKNIEKALEYYEKAVKYAKPKSRYHASYALLHIGLIKYLQDNFKEAYESALEAVKLYPNLCEAYFQCAQYAAKLGLYDDAIYYLSEAIKRDRYYCVKVYSERDFDVMREQIRRFFEKLREDAKAKAESEIEKAEELLKKAESYGVKSNELEEAINGLNEAKEFLRRGSLFDYWDAIPKAQSAQKMIVEASIEYLSDQISEVEGKYNSRISEIEGEYNSRISEIEGKYNSRISKIVDEYNSHVRECNSHLEECRSRAREKNVFSYNEENIIKFFFFQLSVSIILGYLTGSVSVGIATFFILIPIYILLFPLLETLLENFLEKRCIIHYEECIRKYKESYEDSIKKCKESYENSIRKCKEFYEDSIRRCKESYETKFSELQTKYEELKKVRIIVDDDMKIVKDCLDSIWKK